MPLFSYNRDIPDAPNNPSSDQPLMKTNTNSTDDLIDVDHFSFDESNGGLHRQVQLPVRGGGGGSIPPGLVAGEGTEYTKTANSATQLFYTPDASGNEYQLTRTVASAFASFSTGGIGASGWSFLPGGLLIQWGETTKNTDDPITFPTPFTTAVYSIQLTGFYPTNSRGFWWVKTSSTTQFTAALRDSSGSNVSTSFYWMAIGK